MRLAFRIFGYFANPAQDSLFHLSSLLRAFPAPTLRCCLGGFFYFSSCYRGRAFISTVSSPKTTRSLGNSSRTPQLTLWSKPLPYNTVSQRLVSCYWLGVNTKSRTLVNKKSNLLGQTSTCWIFFCILGFGYYLAFI